MDDPALWLVLRDTPELLRRDAWSLVENLGTPSQIVGRPRSQFPDHFPAAVVEWLSRGGGIAAARRELELARRGACSVLAGDDPSFPELLREIPDPPLLLYYRGELPSSPAVAIVGSRRATTRGKANARQLGRALAQAGVWVVSGLAYGIDAAAHAGALEGGGATAAVLASGLDLPSPQGNRRMAERILSAGGCWLSEHPLGTPARPGHFPERNRLISGLASATVVVEARERSGTLWTARHAIEQNRELLAVPGPVDTDACRGSNALLREAMPVLDPSDVFAAIGLDPRTVAERSEASLSPLARTLLGRLRSGASELDELARELAVPAATLLEALLELELGGSVLREGSRIRLC